MDTDTTIYIPLGDQGHLKLSSKSLPKDPKPLITRLNSCKVPINFWLDIALLYHRKNQDSQFQMILEEAIKDDQILLDNSNTHMFEN